MAIMPKILWLKEALARRGYSCEIKEPDYKQQTTYQLLAGPVSAMILSVPRRSLVVFTPDRTISYDFQELEARLNIEPTWALQFILAQLAPGYEHVHHMCGFPLLRERKNAGQHDTLSYRAASDGPAGAPLLECPQCLEYVQDNTVAETIDA